MRDFSEVRRIIIKIGTNTLAKGSQIDIEYMNDLALQVKKIIDLGMQVVIVTSGAIGMGTGRLAVKQQIPKQKVKTIKFQQACAAIGQPLLMYEYHKAFSAFGLIIAQVLITAEVLSHRTTYMNLRNSIETLLHLGAIPIINENDTISTDEIEIGTAFGDNDRLSAYVASKLDADLLILLTDIDTLYDKDPRRFPDAQKILLVTEITDEIEKAAGGTGSSFSKGGMKTKLKAAKIIHNTRCRMVMAHGREKEVILRIIEGENIGTLFLPKERIGNRVRWILHAKPAGTIVIDNGAMKAVENHKSLLPSGIMEIKGAFTAGSVVMLNERAKAVTSMSSDELNLVLGKHSKEIRSILGSDRRDVVAVPEDIVFLEVQNL